MARFRCPVRLLVVTPDPHVARWARRGIHHHGLSLEPIVVCLAELPPIVDPEAARKVPELAVLSAIAHPSLQAANAALEAVRALASPQAEIACDLILAALSVPVRQLLEAQMQDYDFQSGLAQRWLAKKSAELVAKAAAEAAEARCLGHAQGLALAAVELARSKLGALDAAEEAALRQLQDPAHLTELIVNLGQATTPEAARAALQRAGKRQP